jgi:hypothetical protein
MLNEQQVILSKLRLQSANGDYGVFLCVLACVSPGSCHFI